MVKRTRNQAVGHAAELRALSIFSSAGWSGEKLDDDFGEDLVFKLFFEEHREPIRIYCQVKSQKKSSEHVTISTELLRIWQSSIDVHLIVLILNGEDTLRVFLPNLLLDPIDIFQTDKKSKSIRVADFRHLDTEQKIHELTWLVRFVALERGHAYAQGQAFACRFPEGNPDAELSDGFSLLSAKYLHHFLTYVGITPIASSDVFEIGKSEEAEWFVEYCRKICAGTLRAGNFGDDLIEDARHWLRFQMQERDIPQLAGECLMYQASRWLVSIVSAKLSAEGLDVTALCSDSVDFG